jgi:cytochrome c
MSLELNKIAASVLLAGIVAVGTGIITNSLIYPHGHEAHTAEGEEAPKRGYSIAGAEAFEAGAAGGATAAADAGPVDIAAYMQNANAEAGAASLKKCTTCHDFTKGGPNKVGPNLWNILGNSVGHQGDYAYSKVISDAHAAGEKWSYQHLSDFIASPKKTYAGTKMAFAGISKPEERANLIAYLRTLSDNPVALPKAPAAAPAAE